MAHRDFDNGYSLSIIADGYGSERGLLEVLLFATESQKDISDDATLRAAGLGINPQGWLTHRAVETISDKVKALPALLQAEKLRQGAWRHVIDPV